MLLFLYFILFISIYIGFNIKKKYRILEKLKNKDNISSDLIYLLFFLFGTFGVIFTYYKIIDILKIKGVLEATISGKANQLKYALYDNYTLGVLSLRYVTGQTFALFLIRRVIYKKEINIRFLSYYRTFFSYINFSKNDFNLFVSHFFNFLYYKKRN